MREYIDWEFDARHAKKTTMELADELRDRWDDWKDQSPYDSWEECSEAELGVKAASVRQARYRANASTSVSVDNVDTDVDLGARDESPADHKQYPKHKAKPDELKRRVAEVSRLWEAGYNRDDIAGALGVANGTVDSDLRAAGVERGKRPAAQLKPRGAKIKTKPWRNKEDQDNVVVYLKTKPPQCELDEKQVDQVIHEVDQALTDLENDDQLTAAQIAKLIQVLNRSRSHFAVVAKTTAGRK